MWPFENKNNLQCSTFNVIKNKIDKFYENNFKGYEKRKLIWNKNLVTCTLKYKKYTITVNSDIVDFILNFNTCDYVEKDNYSHLKLSNLFKINLIYEKNNNIYINDNFEYKMNKIKL